MLGEKRSGDIFGPGPKRETGGQEAMAGGKSADDTFPGKLTTSMYRSLVDSFPLFV